MDPWLQRFLQGFSFHIDYRALRYIAVCAFAIVGALLGAYLSGGDTAWIILSGAGFYIAGCLVVWAKYRDM
ncbi:MAG: hypothetical protein WCJ93_04390 [Methanomicrobiales archaeon]